MSRALPIPALAVALVLSCGKEAVGPATSLCDTRHGVEVCVDKSEYGRSERLIVTTTNVSGNPIFRDSCAIKPTGVTNLSAEFEEVYNPRLHCGPEVTRADIVERMVEIAPGASADEILGFAIHAFQGWYRVNVWILDREGNLAFDTPAVSGVFRVHPSTN
ncbi:MAG: hypothetical protein F4164_10345 [Gemmatimonadales bacterium]|nr:hypothetical protein [Gemmatimonadales bacterium]MYG49749.1 hypothetical protein [Gemmatimonadales bacterium]MYK01555.1 hypothetical protein [Candidatus Palauibacter ramosifaciens]